MEEPLFMFQLIIAVDVSEHRSIYNKLNAPCSGDFKFLFKIKNQAKRIFLNIAFWA